MIYGIQEDYPSGPIKIGLFDAVLGTAHKRLKGLQTGNPRTLTVLGVMEGTLQDEHEIHEELHTSRIRNEWFRPTPEVLAFISTLSTFIPIKLYARTLPNASTLWPTRIANRMRAQNSQTRSWNTIATKSRT